MWKEAEGDGQHEVWLRTADTEPSLLLRIGRSVELLWSPDSGALAITDREGSDGSDVVVVVLRQPLERLSAEESLVAAVGRSAAIYASGHRYFRARRWLAPSSLLFEVVAHDAAPGEEYRASFRLDLDGQVQPASE